MRVDITTDDRGRRLAVKRAGDQDDAARLRREADLLDAATHPGLVEVLEFVDGPETVLSTSGLEGPTLAGDGPLDVEEVAGAVAAVASTLADLHGLGLVHGAVAPEHVLLDGDGRPVLCSLGYGGLTGERRPGRPGVAPEFVDPARSEDDPLDPTIDVYATGALLSFLLGKANGRARGAPADALRRIADKATAAAVADRPTARRLADDIHDHVAGARLPRSAATPVAPPRPSPLDARRRQRPLEGWRQAQVPAAAAPRRRLRTVTLAMTAGLAVAVAVLLIQRAQSPPSPDLAVAETAPDVAATAPGTSTGAPPRATAPGTSAAAPLPTTTSAPGRPVPPTQPRAGCPEVFGPLSADVDGDGCAEAVHFSGGIAEASGLRWQVGEADDVVAVGDWSCSGNRSLAVLRPGTGEVFAFAGWATADHQLDAPLLARVAGGRALRAADLDADGCNELVVERAEGAPAVLRAPRTGP